MSRAALIESLRSKAAEDAEAVWREAKAGAEKYRLEMAQALERGALAEPAGFDGGRAPD